MAPVQLAIYDLSHGMASSLSLQFVGTQIDLIPHSGVIVFGEEIFFGGGIQRTPHAQFTSSHNIQPQTIIDLGETTKSLSEINTWLALNSSRYTASTYHLLANNCNNFADDLLKNGLSIAGGVPQHILSIPQQFLSSPMGNMIAPMITSMYQPFSSSSTASPIPTTHTPPPPTTINNLDFTNLLENAIPIPTPPINPTPTPEFTSQLADLAMMGFEDSSKNQQALLEANGCLELAITILTSDQ